MTPYRKWPYPQPKTYYDVKKSQRPICVNQGGSRSGKTWSTLQVICEFCRKHVGRNYIISIVRKTTPALKASAYRDFLDILLKEGWYNEKFHNKTELTYNLFGNLIEFFATDDQQKLRGRRRHIVFINEANELPYEDFLQLKLRTEYKMILDFNPSDETHWIYELPKKEVYAKNHPLAGQTKVDYFITNYTHNPHLPEGLIDNIESLEGADEDYWKVFGLGLRGSSRELIYTHWQYCDAMPGVGDSYCFGLDFGFNVPSALVKVEFLEDSVYVDEQIYQPKLITSDIADHMDKLGIDFSDDLWCDAAAADSIEELQRRGFDARKANKDVLEGIRSIKSKKLFITRCSFNLAKELRNYKWKKDPKTDKILDEPVKFNDHACFTGETLITTADGEKRIDSLQPKDMVLTSKGFKPVVRVFDNGIKSINEYRIESSNFTTVVRCTPDHRIYVNDTWKAISDIQPGDTVNLYNSLTVTKTAPAFHAKRLLEQTNTKNQYSVQKVVVSRIHGTKNGQQRVYDIEVADQHEYFANGLLVHNCDAMRYAIYSHNAAPQAPRSYAAPMN